MEKNQDQTVKTLDQTGPADQIDPTDQPLALPEVFRCGTPANEQETTINFFRDDEYAVVYTNDNTMLTKLKRLQKTSPQAYIVTRVFKLGGEVSGVEVKFPKRLLSFRNFYKTIEGVGAPDASDAVDS